MNGVCAVRCYREGLVSSLWHDDEPGWGNGTTGSGNGGDGVGEECPDIIPITEGKCLPRCCTGNFDDASGRCPWIDQKILLSSRRKPGHVRDIHHVADLKDIPRILKNICDINGKGSAACTGFTIKEFSLEYDLDTIRRHRDGNDGQQNGEQEKSSKT